MLGCTELGQLAGHCAAATMEKLIVLGYDLCFPMQYRGTADLALSVRCLTHRK